MKLTTKLQVIWRMCCQWKLSGMSGNALRAFLVMHIFTSTVPLQSVCAARIAHLCEDSVIIVDIWTAPQLTAVCCWVFQSQWCVHGHLFFPVLGDLRVWWGGQDYRHIPEGLAVQLCGEIDFGRFLWLSFRKKLTVVVKRSFGSWGCLL